MFLNSVNCSTPTKKKKSNTSAHRLHCVTDAILNKVSTKEVHDLVLQISAFIRSCGVYSRGRCGIYGANCTRCVISMLHAGPQCCENPPTLSSSSGGGGVVQQFGGLTSYIAAPPHPKAAVILLSDVFGYDDWFDKCRI